MTERKRPEPSCSIARALDVVGDRWSLLILREAHNGITRFADFRRLLGIAPDILTQRLANLVESGVLEKRRYQPEGERARDSYHLTESGEDLKLVLAALQQWGDVHRARADGPTVFRREQSSGKPLGIAFVDADGVPVPSREVVFEPLKDSPADRYRDWR